MKSTSSFQAALALPQPPLDLSGEHGEVFTRRWVVELILDLVGYTSDRDLAALQLVEPACGCGAFLTVIAERLSKSCRTHGRDITEARDAVQGFDLLPDNVMQARSVVRSVLMADGWPADDTQLIAEAWVNPGDYLLAEFELATADVVVGNPPYIRLEDIPPARMAAYRSTWPTMTGRADVFIGFIERGLRSLKPDGKLGFICADRWMRNQYGKHLRQLIGERFSVDAVVTMHDVDAFENEVSAYPAVTVLSNRSQASAVIADTTAAFGPSHAADVLDFAAGGSGVVRPKGKPYKLARLPHWFRGAESWPQGSPGRLAMIEYLTDNFRPLEDAATGTKVGIGIATGADKIYVVPERIDVEDDRLLPMAMVRDLASGAFEWSGNYLVSPWQATGLVELDDYPRLRSYLEQHGAALRKRHVATARPKTWFRTIDRVDVGLTGRPKLLIPDMRMTLHPVLDEGAAYPHHNLYYVTSDKWDLRVLGGLLMSRVANAFIEAYAVKMRGGTLRFQSQYLRRIRVPELASVTPADADALSAAFEARDVEAATAVAVRLYKLNEIGGFAE
ncbi:SAM-dependent methyltransferase [Blastococcus sp. TF02-09]|uniref:Eco57I restriction-modification methylase domain-containing protein n=1 Tax=Blastococcus sp. TF02-09 TaxID=2250576 RepID=UPI000DEB87B0|nr:N-6 DNA methylase [Blastococcus sp. TF02-9]RBY76877.1 SAM-dependent methyltransferase [Blastococcus sp. TF02-9]